MLRDYALVKRVALLACLAHKARMRVRDDLATMFCKRIATEIKRAKAELEEIRLRPTPETPPRCRLWRGAGREEWSVGRCVAVRVGG